MEQSFGFSSIFEHHVVELKKQLHLADQREFFEDIKSVLLQEMAKVEPKCIHD